MVILGILYFRTTRRINAYWCVQNCKPTAYPASRTGWFEITDRPAGGRR
jgi:hypothetical protein